MKLTLVMEYRNIIEFILKNQNFPWIFIFSIPISGFVLSYIGFETAFLRSGAIMIIVAVISVYLNHFVIKADAVLNAVRLKLNNPDLDTSMSMALGANMIDLKSDEDKEIVEQIKELGKKDIQALELINKKITAIEFFSGTIGTFIWGFGDLFFSVPCCH